MSRCETPLEAVLKGALAGLAGGIAIMVAMQSAQQLMPSPAPPPEGAPPEEPREKLVRKIATGILEVEPSEEQRAAWARAVHWLYSAFWGAAYGIVQSSLPLPKWLKGLLLGTKVFVAGYAVLLPVTKLAPPLGSMPPSFIGMGWAFHAIYGLTTVYTYAALSSCKTCPLRR